MNEDTPQRYDLSGCRTPECMCYAEMQPEPQGEYVKHADYAALELRATRAEKDRDELKAHAGRLREALAQGLESLESFISDSRDPGTGALSAAWMMKAALASTPEASGDGWRDISTAPKDGKKILVLMPLIGTIRGFWDDDRYSQKPKPYWSSDAKHMGVRWHRENPPTHWMPLRPPLSNSTKEQA